MEPAVDEVAVIEAQYQLERPAKCPHCSEVIHELHAVRLLRIKVNFTSNLPRRGCAFVCPACQAFLSASIGARLAI